MDELLRYNDEETDAEPLITAQYSREWLSHLLGVVSILEQPGLWKDEGEHDTIMVQVHDLISRLMGESVVAGNYYGGLPLLIPVVALSWNPSVTPTKYYTSAGYFTGSCVVTDGDNEAVGMFAFDVALEIGDYVVEMFHSKGPNMGKIDASCTFEPDLFDMVDCYAATTSHNHIAVAEFEVTSPSIVAFGFNKQVKNPLASACQILMNAVIVREKTQYD